MNKASILTVIVVLLMGGLVATTGLIYGVYTPQIASQNEQIADQDDQITHLNERIAGLNDQISDLQDDLSALQSKYTANLVTGLGINDVGSNESRRHLYISGTVTNNGVIIAYNTGLHIVGYGSNHEVLIDMTAPLSAGVTYQNGFSSSGELSTLSPGVTTGISISIYHEGAIDSYTITPVFNNDA